jgi:hypothetical protein
MQRPSSPSPAPTRWSNDIRSMTATGHSRRSGDVRIESGYPLESGIVQTFGGCERSGDPRYQERHNSGHANTCHLCHLRTFRTRPRPRVVVDRWRRSSRLHPCSSDRGRPSPATPNRDDPSSGLSRSTAFRLSGPMRQDHASRTLPQQKQHHPREYPSCLQ